MKITYYGTGAGEGWPGVFCQCELCQKARELGGRNIRTRSQTLINRDLLIDLPPDNQLHSLFYGLDLSKVDALLFTHSHSDHCYPEDLEFLREPFSHTRRGRLWVGGNEAVAEKIDRLCGQGNEETRFQYTILREFDPVKVSDYTIVPFLAKHMEDERCLFYGISQGEKHILYANDTGLFTEEDMTFLKKQGIKYHLVSMDCTSQQFRDGNYHMGLLDNVEQKKRLIDAGAADENTIWVLNHFSHNGGWLYDEMASEAEKYGFLVSYDGMTIEF